MEVLVTLGATVAEGDELVVIESMKMEIPVLAVRAGTIAGVHVAVGDRVAERALLVTLG